MLRYPSLSIPFALDPSPYVEEAERHGRWFVRHFGLVTTDDAKKHFDESLLGVLVGRGCPRADQETIELIADWMGCNLVLDDLFDETEIGKDPDQLCDFCGRVLSWLPEEGAVVTDDDSPFAPAYADLWRRTSARTGRVWRRRFRAHFGRFLTQCVWEANNRKNGVKPGIDEYLFARGCGFMPYIDLIELVARWEMPDDLYQTPIIGELNQSLSDCVLWTNDLFSCEKEYRLGDVHNLVIILAGANNIDLQEAANIVGDKIRGRIDDFVGASTEIIEEWAPRQDLSIRSALVEHVENMRSWLCGQMQWRLETKRNNTMNLAVKDGKAVRTY